MTKIWGRPCGKMATFLALQSTQCEPASPLKKKAKKKKKKAEFKHILKVKYLLECFPELKPN